MKHLLCLRLFEYALVCSVNSHAKYHHVQLHVTGNEFFLIATGLSEREAKRLTIFSIVQSNQLSDLYKMVARALAEKSMTSTAAAAATVGTTSKTDITPAAGKHDNTNSEEWQAITLKCIPFPSQNKSTTETKTTNPTTASTMTEEKSTQLYITVALMEDEHREQRCFHCILTDCPGTKEGKLGNVTPELFAMLFTRGGGSTKKKVGAGVLAK